MAEKQTLVRSVQQVLSRKEVSIFLLGSMLGQKGSFLGLEGVVSRNGVSLRFERSDLV